LTPQEDDGFHSLRSVGIGLRQCHLSEFLATRPPLGWVEVNPENYLCGGAVLRALALVRRDYELSLHSVGLSLGSADGVQTEHLARLVSLNAQLEPGLFSDHLSWSISNGTYFNALLPLPYNQEALTVVCRNIDFVQQALGRRILVENVASYLRFRHSEIPEPEFLMEVARRTGCGVLCDITNIFVTWGNFGLAPGDYIRALTPAVVGQVHLGGHCRTRSSAGWILFDDHGRKVDKAVWSLYRQAMRRFGPKPTLIEWDAHLPPLEVLNGEARHAGEIMAQCCGDLGADQ
jgi:uncharacterized protein (UPF0276 family)